MTEERSLDFSDVWVRRIDIIVSGRIVVMSI